MVRFLEPRRQTVFSSGRSKATPKAMPAKDGFELQDQDIELLHSVHQLRIATIDHLAALSGRSARALWGRLLKLRERRDLSSVARFMQKHVYAIGSAGVPVLIEHGYAPEAITHQRVRHNELKDLGIRHAVFMADIHTRMLLLTGTGPLTLPRWEEGQLLWDAVPAVDGEASIPVRPDAYFVLKHAGRPEGRNRFHVFLEADRSTMSHQRMAAKIAGYVAYYERRLHAKKYPGMQSFVVVTVTETRSRAEELQKDLQSLVPNAARHAYLFIPFEDLTLSSLLPKAAASVAA
jgi:hypothetical protein